MTLPELVSSIFYRLAHERDVKSTRLRVAMSLQEMLGDYVRRVINEKGLNYREVARRSGGRISHATVGYIVNGVTKDVGTETLQALARGLQVSEDELFAVARGKTLEPMSPQDFYSALEALGVEQFQAYGGVENLSDEDRAEIVGVLTALIEQKLKRKQGAPKARGSGKR